MSGVDIALWDIKGKRADMPLYQLLGGKVRHGADCYFHASGSTFDEVADSAQAGDGPRVPPRPRPGQYARAMPATARAVRRRRRARPTRLSGRRIPRAIWEPAPYCRMLPKFFEHMRTRLGDEVELLHDVHERITLNQAVNLCKALEPYRLFFLEDPFPPEENDHFRLLRQQTSIPLAMGELFNTQHEYLPLIKERLIDFIRIHISQIGGLSPGPQGVARSPSSSASVPPGTVRATRHRSPTPHSSRSSCTSYNFGVHEGSGFPKETQEVFAGCPGGAEWLHACLGQAGPRHRLRRGARRQVPHPGGTAELRLLVGDDPAP